MFRPYYIVIHFRILRILRILPYCLLNLSLFAAAPSDSNKLMGPLEQVPHVLHNGGELKRVVSIGSVIELPCPPVGGHDEGYSFQWTKDSDPIARPYRVAELWPGMSVTSSGSLRIESVKREDDGHFVCRAINGLGTVELRMGTTLVVLRDGEETRYSQQLQSHKVMKKKRVTEWNGNGEGKSVKKSDVGAGSKQRAVARDSRGKGTSGIRPGRAAHFSANSPTPGREKPTLHVVTRNDNVIQRPAGSTLRLKCVPSNSRPKPNITWFRNGSPLKLEGEKRRGRWTLTLEKVEEEDAGNYTCLVNNGWGSTSASFLVDILGGRATRAEVTDSQPVNTTVELGGSATFQCRVRSDVMPHIQWLKRVDPQADHNWDESSSYRSSLSGHGLRSVDQAAYEEHIVKVQGELFRVLRSSENVDRKDGSFLNKLIISKARESDSGKYICLGANSMGYSFRSAFLTVLPTNSPVAAAHHHHHHFHSSFYPTAHHPHPGLLLVGLPILLGIAVAVALVVVVNCYRRRSEPHIPDLSDQSEELLSCLELTYININPLQSNNNKIPLQEVGDKVVGFSTHGPSIRWLSPPALNHHNDQAGNAAAATPGSPLSQFCGTLLTRHSRVMSPHYSSSSCPPISVPTPLSPPIPPPPPCCEDCDCCVNHMRNQI